MAAGDGVAAAAGMVERVTSCEAMSVGGEGVAGGGVFVEEEPFQSGCGEIPIIPIGVIR